MQAMTLIFDQPAYEKWRKQLGSSDFQEITAVLKMIPTIQSAFATHATLPKELTHLYSLVKDLKPNVQQTADKAMALSKQRDKVTNLLDNAFSSTGTALANTIRWAKWGASELCKGTTFTKPTDKMRKLNLNDPDFISRLVFLSWAVQNNSWHRPEIFPKNCENDIATLTKDKQHLQKPKFLYALLFNISQQYQNGEREYAEKISKLISRINLTPQQVTILSKEMLSCLESSQMDTASDTQGLDAEIRQAMRQAAKDRLDQGKDKEAQEILKQLEGSDEEALQSPILDIQKLPLKSPREQAESPNNEHAQNKALLEIVQENIATILAILQTDESQKRMIPEIITILKIAVNKLEISRISDQPDYKSNDTKDKT